jgi:hypothetical protein
MCNPAGFENALIKKPRRLGGVSSKCRGVLSPANVDGSSRERRRGDNTTAGVRAGEYKGRWLIAVLLLSWVDLVILGLIATVLVWRFTTGSVLFILSWLEFCVAGGEQ